MLIGPTFTLAEFEEKLEDRLLENRTRDSKALKEFKEAQQNIGLLPRLVTDEESGQSLANPEYLKAVETGKKAQLELEEIAEQNDFIKAKLEELETIEERSRGAIDKNKEKITLTLKDCVELGIDTSGDE